MEARFVKKRPSLIKPWLVVVCLFLSLIILVFLGSLIWIKTNLSPVSTSTQKKSFVIKEGEPLASVGQRLQEEGLIRNSFAFQLYLKYSCVGLNLVTFEKLVRRESQNCLDKQIQAGSFNLSESMSVEQLSLVLTKGRADSWLRVVEGLRKEEIAALVAKNYTVSAEAFLKIAQEGYLFPDTYLFSIHSTAEDIVKKMKANFDTKLTSDIRFGFQKQGLTLAQGVVLASILERETVNQGDERPTVAGIFYNRLRSGWKLEADSTVQYALGYDKGEKTWWRKILTEADLNVDNPFNTRLYPGLPPAPICNPGLSALKAAAFPLATNHYYYLHDGKGQIHYADTLQQHNQNKALYLQ